MPVFDSILVLINISIFYCNIMYDFFIFTIVYRSIFYVYFHPVNYYIFNCFIQLFLMQYLHRYIPVYSGVILCFYFKKKKMGIIPIFLYGYFYGFSELIPSLARSSINKPLFSGYAPIVCFYRLKPCCFVDHKIVHSTYLV